MVLHLDWLVPYQGATQDTLGTFAYTNERKLMVLHLDWLVPYQGAAQDKLP
jgi:hypothetical protein